MYHANFCIKYKDSGSPEKSSGTALFYLCDKYYAYHLCYFICPSGTGFDQSTQGLAALYYVMLLGARQVMHWHSSFLLPEAAAHRETVWPAGVKAERVPA